MSKGYVILVQNNKDVDYIRMAAYLATSIKQTQKNITSVSIITDDVISVEKSYSNLFDNIIEIPWQDAAQDSVWKVENRWKIYHVSPYEQTVILDADMLFLNDISHWWDHLEKNFDVCVTSQVKTYRNEIVTNDFYRKAFTFNSLPNSYTAFVYFKKNDFAKNFWKLVEIISKNWQEYYGKFLKEYKPEFLSMDVVFALAIKILDIEEQVTSTLDYPTFVHMKSHIQNWQSSQDDWMNMVSVDLDKDLNLVIGNHFQTDIFHYTEKKFTKKLEELKLIDLEK